MSQQQLIQEASSYETPGTSTSTIRNAVTGRRGYTPSTTAIEAIARALQVDPGEFALYRYAKAKEFLDPAKVGPATAHAAADILWSNRSSFESPAQVAEEAAERIEGTRSATAPAPKKHTRKGRAA